MDPMERRMDEARVVDPLTQVEVVVEGSETHEETVRRYRRGIEEARLRYIEDTQRADERRAEEAAARQASPAARREFWTGPKVVVAVVAVAFVSFFAFMLGSASDNTPLLVAGFGIFLLNALPLLLVCLYGMYRLFSVVMDPFMSLGSGPSRSASTIRTKPTTSWQAAEAHAAAWMGSNGYPGAAVTRPGADGGVDVVSSTAVSQVKHRAVPTGAPEIRQLFGVAQSQRKEAVFFSRAGYTRAARKFAAENDVRLFILDDDGRVIDV